VLADALATLRESPAGTGGSAIADAADEAEADTPTAKVYFVEFPPAAPAETPASVEPPVSAGPAAEPEIVLPETGDAGLFQSEEERSEWAPPMEIPTWWTRGGAQR
jgi:hypothetical protein